MDAFFFVALGIVICALSMQLSLAAHARGKHRLSRIVDGVFVALMAISLAYVAYIGVRNAGRAIWDALV